MEKRFTYEATRFEGSLLLDFFFNFDTFIQREYRGLYERRTKGDGTDWRPGDYELDSRWNWFALVERLAGGDITKFDEIYEKNYIECLNLISYWKEKDHYVDSINKRQLQQQKYR